MRNGLPALGGGESSGQIRMSTHLYSKRKVCNPIFIGYKLIIRGGFVMPKKSVVLLPETENILAQMGEQIKLARLRRRISATLVAERAGISRATLVAIEKGAPSVAIGCYAAVLHALNYMDKDLLLVAKDDELGRKLQDLGIMVNKRVRKG